MAEAAAAGLAEKEVVGSAEETDWRSWSMWTRQQVTKAKPNRTTLGSSL